MDARTSATLALDEIAAWWAELEQDLLPGTRRRWYQRDETDEQRTARRYEDAKDRVAKQLELIRGRHPNGYTASPVVDPVLDVKVEVEATVTRLWLLVHDRIASAQSIEPRPVSVMARWLSDVLPGLADQHLLDELAHAARSCAAAVVRATGRSEPILTLQGRCPSCQCRSLRAWPLRETARCVNSACGRVWAGKQQLAWLSRLIGGGADPLATTAASVPS